MNQLDEGFEMEVPPKHKWHPSQHKSKDFLNKLNTSSICLLNQSFDKILKPKDGYIDPEEEKKYQYEIDDQSKQLCNHSSLLQSTIDRRDELFTPARTQNNDETAIDIQQSNIDDKKQIELDLEQKPRKSNDDDFHREFLKVLQDGQPRSTRRSINRTEFGFCAKSL